MLSSTREKIVALKANPAETNINFNNEVLGDEGATLLADALNGRQIQSLSLDSCGITNEGLKLLVPIINSSPNLHTLDLSNQVIELSLLTLKSLKTLILKNCGINENQVPNLNTIITNNPGLTQLTLDGNAITPVILQALQAKQWDMLSLSKCNLTLKDCLIFIPNVLNNPDFLNVEGNQFSNQSWFARYTQALIASKMTEQQEILNKQNLEISQLTKKLAEVKANLEKVEAENEANNQALVAQFESKLAEMNSRIKTFPQLLNDQLFTACKTGKKLLADQACQMGADVKAVDPLTGQTALSLCLRGGYLDIADMLFESDKTVLSFPNQSGETPVEQMVAKDENIRQSKWVWEKTKTIATSEMEKLSEFKKLYMAASPDTKELLAKDQLWGSVKSGNLDGIKEVLELNELKINVNMFHPTKNETMLYQAFFYGHTDIVRYLLQKGADYRALNHVSEISDDLIDEVHQQELTLRRDTVFDLVCVEKNTQLVKLMISHVLLEGINHGDIEEMQNALTVAKSKLGDNCAEILGEANLNSQCALHLAALNPNEKFMDLLLNNLVYRDPLLETQNSEGKTALHIAVENQNEKVVSLLLSKGASIEAMDMNGQIPLHKAVKHFNKKAESTSSEDVEKASLKIVKGIIHTHTVHNKQIAIKDKEGNTPISIAFKNGNEELAEKLGIIYGKNMTKAKQDKLANSSSRIFSRSYNESERKKKEEVQSLDGLSNKQISDHDESLSDKTSYSRGGYLA